MDLEFQQLDLRYEGLRSLNPARERRLLASLSENGQQTPLVVVVAAAAAAESQSQRYVLVDGYKRVRALRRLHHDVARAVCWDLGEQDALLLERLMRSPDGESPLEQGWLLRELRDRFAIPAEELARRFDRSASWVSRRLALVSDLPAEVQERVRRGELVAHAAMKYLVPLARANRADCLRLCDGLGKAPPTSRQMGEIYAAYVSGNAKTRELLLADPWLFLRAQAEARRRESVEKTPSQQLLADFSALAAIARRTSRRLREGLAQRLLEPERDEVLRCHRQARADAERLWELCEKELRPNG